MRKVAVYAGTRNLYEMMKTAVVSLTTNTEMDTVYLMIEDDEFPFQLPENVKTINVSGQTFFPEEAANTKNRWSYMALMKLALTKLLPDEDRVLWLDCDTIVDDDISDLFETDMGNNWFAGVREYCKCVDGVDYINAGVLMINLAQLRADKADDALIDLVNTKPLELPDQDAINQFSQGKMVFLASDYNVCTFTRPPEKLRIYHYAARVVWDNDPLYRKYSGKETPIRTLIAIPCMQMVHSGFMRSMLELDRVENTAVVVMENSLIYDARNSIALNAIRSGFDRVVWFDSDMKIPKDTLIRLMEDMDKGLEFVSGVYYQKTTLPKPVLYENVWYKVTENEAQAGAKQIKTMPHPAGLFEIGGAGFGCCITSATMLKKLIDRWGAPFTPMIGLGEDMAFCWRAAQLGIKMYADNRILCGHIGTKIYDGADD